MSMLNKMKEAADAHSASLDAFALYIKSISIARQKYEEVAKEMEIILKMPDIKLEDFEIDG